MATINLILDKRRTNKDNNYPLVFRIYAGNKSRYLSTGIIIPKNQFNIKSGEILGDFMTNNTLQKLKVDYLQKLNLYTLKNNGVENVQELKDFLLNKLKGEKTIKSFWEEQINSLNSIGKTSNAKLSKLFSDNQLY